MTPSKINYAVFILLSTLVMGLKPSHIDSNQHFVGEVFGGGIIFQLDESKMHGLICSLSDIQDASTQKISDYSATPGNSSSLISNPERAYDLCASYINFDSGIGRFSDWYLPSIDELKILYQVKKTMNESLEKYNPKVVDYLDKVYWSSSKVKTDLIQANQLIDFENGTLIIFSNRPLTFVRAIRKF